MGQTYLGPAILHHLEGFHVQSLDIGTLMADSTRTPEATLVQLFVEAKRHQPSILFIPSLLAWSHALTDSARTTFQSLLDGVSSSDPVLLLAMADVPAHDIPRDIRSWFGASIESRAELTTPTIVSLLQFPADFRPSATNTSPLCLTHSIAHPSTFPMPSLDKSVSSRTYLWPHRCRHVNLPRRRSNASWIEIRTPAP